MSSHISLSVTLRSLGASPGLVGVTGRPLGKHHNEIVFLLALNFSRLYTRFLRLFSRMDLSGGEARGTHSLALCLNRFSGLRSLLDLTRCRAASRRWMAEPWQWTHSWGSRRDPVQFALNFEGRLQVPPIRFLKDRFDVTQTFWPPLKRIEYNSERFIKRLLILLCSHVLF